MKFWYIIILYIIISLGGCMQETQKPKDLIDEDKYINLLVELQLVRSYGESTQTDSLTVDSLTSEVFKRYEISAENFWTSHKYYQSFPQKQKVRIEKAIERLKMDQVSNASEDTTSDDH